jgi:hypothetical protein
VLTIHAYNIKIKKLILRAKIPTVPRSFLNYELSLKPHGAAQLKEIPDTDEIG